MTQKPETHHHHHHPERPLYAVSLRLAAMLMGSIMFATVKWLSEQGVHLIETLFYRQLFAVPVAFAAMMLGPGIGALRTRKIGTHISRSAIGMLSMALNFGAVILLPLAEAMTIGFTTPIFATILSVLFLGERPGVHRWLAIIVGFAGVVIIIGPSGHENAMSAGFAVAIAAAIGSSVASLLLRQLGKTEEPTTTVFYFSILSVLPLAIAMVYFGRWHDTLVWLALLGMGVSGGLTQLLMTSALRWGPVSLVLPIDYSTLLWSTALGWLLWSSWPRPTTWIGAAIIAGSSLYIVWRERVRHREYINRGVDIS